MSLGHVLWLPLIGLAVWSAGAQDSGQSQRRKLEMPKPGILDITKSCRGAHEVDVDLNVGDVEILPSRDADQMRLNIRSGSREKDGVMDGWVERFGVSDGIAHVVVKLPKARGNHKDASVTIYIPAQATLRAHLGIGDMLVQGIKGDKTVDVGIGDLTISASGADEYGEVRASTRIGDVSDSLHGAKTKGWLGKTEKVAGAGKYKLQAHVGIGDLKIEKEGETP